MQYSTHPFSSWKGLLALVPHNTTGVNYQLECSIKVLSVFQCKVAWNQNLHWMSNPSLSPGPSNQLNMSFCTAIKENIINSLPLRSQSWFQIRWMIHFNGDSNQLTNWGWLRPKPQSVEIERGSWFIDLKGNLKGDEGEELGNMEWIVYGGGWGGNGIGGGGRSGVRA